MTWILFIFVVVDRTARPKPFQSFKSKRCSTPKSSTPIDCLLIAIQLLPHSQLADWQGPELVRHIRNKSIVGCNSWTDQPTPASDVFGFGQLVRFMLNHARAQQSDYLIPKNAQSNFVDQYSVIIEHATRFRKEERLELRQFHRLLIHWFWVSFVVIH